MVHAWLDVANLFVVAPNVLPAFMPPTWSILALFLIQYPLPLLPDVFGGAVAATSGIFVLTRAGCRWERKLMSVEQRAGDTQLGTWLGAKIRGAAPAAFFIYSFGPIASNRRFIAVSLT